MKQLNILESMFELSEEKENKEVFSDKKYAEIDQINKHLALHLEKLNFQQMTKI